MDYTNSGDAPRGDKSGVVGYWAISFDEKKEEPRKFLLTADEKKQLLQIAHDAVEDVVLGKKHLGYDLNNLPDKLTVPMGAFVSLHRKGNLRGCIGRLEAEMPLWETVHKMAVSAATRDYRFERLSADELPDLQIEISVLTPMHQIGRAHV